MKIAKPKAKLGTPKKKVLPILSINQRVEEYSLVSGKMKMLDARKKELADVIKEHAKNEGIEDTKGSKYCNNDRFVFGSQARSKVNVNSEEATEFLKKHKLFNEASTVIPAKRVLDLEKLAKLVELGNISTAQFETLCDKKTTYAVYVKEIKDVDEEEMPEVIKIELRKRRA